MTVGDLWPEPVSPATSSGGLPPLIPDNLVQVRAEWIDFYDTHYHRVVRFLMHNGASQTDAQDAAQDAFIESFDLMTRAPDRWLAVAGKATWIRTVALRRYRRPPGPRRRPFTAGDEIPDIPAPGPGHDELTVQAQLVMRALQSLNGDARTVMAFDMDGIPAADIADALGITQQRVRDVRKKARMALKQELAGHTTPGRRQP
jgi:RNA polymerase sigma-70 factor (ECF subfamily)